MYAFGFTVLLGLALLELVDVLRDVLPQLDRWRSLLTVLLAVAGVYGLDFSLPDRFGIALRNDWMGTLVTGLVVAGAVMMWRAVFGWFGAGDAEHAEIRPHRPRVAA